MPCVWAKAVSSGSAKVMNLILPQLKNMSRSGFGCFRTLHFEGDRLTSFRNMVHRTSGHSRLQLWLLFQFKRFTLRRCYVQNHFIDIQLVRVVILVVSLASSRPPDLCEREKTKFRNLERKIVNYSHWCDLFMILTANWTHLTIELFQVEFFYYQPVTRRRNECVSGCWVNLNWSWFGVQSSTSKKTLSHFFIALLRYYWYSLSFKNILNFFSLNLNIQHFDTTLYHTSDTKKTGTKCGQVSWINLNELKQSSNQYFNIL